MSAKTIIGLGALSAIGYYAYNNMDNIKSMANKNDKTTYKAQQFDKSKQLDDNSPLPQVDLKKDETTAGHTATIKGRQSVTATHKDKHEHDDQ